MFVSGRRYRHRRCLDIDIDIVRVTYRGTKYIKAKVLYWNRWYKTHHSLQPELVWIKREDFYQWKLIE